MSAVCQVVEPVVSEENAPEGVVRKIEFKLNFGPKQVARLREYLEAQRWVWNRGLALIEWREWFDKWEKVLASPEHADYSPEPVPLRWELNDHVKTQKKSDKWGLCCDRIKAEKSPRDLLPGEWREDDWILKPHKPELVKEHWVGEPVLRKHGDNPFHLLTAAFCKGLFDADHFIQGIPADWTYGTCKNLGDAWAAHKKKVRDHPRYKKRHQSPRTLVRSKNVRVKGDRLTLPGFGKISVKGLAERWGDRDACPTSVTLVGDAVFLQLTGKFPAKPQPKMTGRVIGIDPGSVRFYTDDEGHHVVPPKYLKQSAKKLLKLQQKQSRQLKVNGTQIFGEDGRVIRTEFPEDWERKNLKKTKAKLAKLHNKIARQRRAFAHFHSTKLVRFADEIILEDFKPANLTRAVKNGEAGKKNGRKRKAALNRNLLDNAIGQFYTQIETKGKAAGRIVIRVPAHHTSQECHVCHHISADNRRSQAKFKCVNCGHEDNADRNAARNIKFRGSKREV